MAETTYDPDSLPDPPNTEMLDIMTSTLGSTYSVKGGHTSKAENDIVVLISEKVSLYTSNPPPLPISYPLSNLHHDDWAYHGPNRF